MKITNDIKYVGVNDRIIDLFEGQYKVPEGMSYNSYVVLDEKISVFDTVDIKFGEEWLENLDKVLAGRTPDYLIVQHMEPDHSSNITKFMEKYEDCIVVSSDKAFVMMKQFFKEDYPSRRIIVKDGDTLSTGKHHFTFVSAQMVHWPEVTMTYDSTDKVLFSADGFGKFGAVDSIQPWEEEARRYYFGIVGKYGMQTQKLLSKASKLEINIICPLHGPVLDENIGSYLNLYDIWSSYKPQEEGIFIPYTSVYGNTKKAVELLKEELEKRGCDNVITFDLARNDMSKAVDNAFRYSKMILATTTYNNDIFPFMREFIHELTERGYQNRTVGIIENGSWAPQVAKKIKTMLECSKNIIFTENTVTIRSALDEDSILQISKLAREIS